jgi:hypothetical protein
VHDVDVAVSTWLLPLLDELENIAVEALRPMTMLALPAAVARV